MNPIEILKKVAWPIQKLDEAASQEIAEKAAIGAKAAMNEVPMLDRFLDGEQITLEVRLPFLDGIFKREVTIEIPIRLRAS